MVEAQFNYFDIVVMSIMFLSCVFALFRGFVKEILSLIGWVGSAYVTMHFYQPFSETLKPHFVNPMAGKIAASVLLYFGALIGFFLLNRSIIKVLKSGSGMGIFDNLLGFVFGALRGAFIISLAYLMMSLVVSEDSRPDWIQKAVTRPYVDQTALMLAKLAPDYTQKFTDMQKKAKEDMQNSISTNMEENLRDKLNNPDALNKIKTAPVENMEYNQDGTNDSNQKNNSGVFDNFLKTLDTKK